MCATAITTLRVDLNFDLLKAATSDILAPMRYFNWAFDAQEKRQNAHTIDAVDLWRHICDGRGCIQVSVSKPKPPNAA